MSLDAQGAFSFPDSEESPAVPVTEQGGRTPRPGGRAFIYWTPIR